MFAWFRRFRSPPPPLVWFCFRRPPVFSFLALSGFARSGPGVFVLVFAATPAPQNEGKCRQVPRLPRETRVDVAKFHACHAKCRGVTGDYARARHQSEPSAISATPAAQRRCGCLKAPRLPRETKVDVAKCQACHAKCGGVTGE